ncbi:MAG: glycosyltransferase [Candidatus Bathyarchaeota archaeon]|nr:glycosyltransferase [Candidatus Bathyarchaeota archaeon]
MSEVSKLGKAQLNDYAQLVGLKAIGSIRKLAEKVEGKSVVNVNSTSYGGGVAEILYNMIPLMRDVGLDAHWKVITGNEEFFNVTKKIHNGLQGMDQELTDKDKETYIKHNRMNRELLSLEADYVVIHDPQPAALIQFFPERQGKWIWRCHIDLSQPNQEILDFVKPYIRLYDASIFSLRRYVKKTLDIKKLALIPPSINPLNDKNRPLRESEILSISQRYNIDPDKPVMTQVARFDPWKDPLGVIDTYRIVKKRIRDVQLILVASMAKDDPEGWTYYEKSVRHAGEDHDIHFLTDLIGVKDLEVNAIQRATDVALQKSLREGFGLSVTEALWKGVPVVGSNVGGIPLQVIDGVDGYLVNTVEEAAEKTIYLLNHLEEAKKMGARGKEHVRKKFLITRHLKDYLKLFAELSNLKEH